MAPGGARDVFKGPRGGGARGQGPGRSSYPVVEGVLGPRHAAEVGAVGLWGRGPREGAGGGAGGGGRAVALGGGAGRDFLQGGVGHGAHVELLSGGTHVWGQEETGRSASSSSSSSS